MMLWFRDKKKRGELTLSSVRYGNLLGYNGMFVIFVILRPESEKWKIQ